MFKSEFIAYCLRVEKVISGVGRLLICQREGTQALKDQKGYKYQIDGVLISEDAIKHLGDDFNMLECDIILIPKKLHSKATGALRPGMTSLQMIVGGYNNTENWEEHRDII